MRWICGSLLIGAALLKAVELVTNGTGALGEPLDRRFQLLQIASELIFGVFLFSAHNWQSLRLIATVLFTSFAGYTAYLAIKGADSCGCFGPLGLSPWLTFGLDAAIVVGLLFSRPGHYGEKGNQDSLVEWPGPRAVTVLVSIGVICTLIIWYFDNRADTAKGVSASGSLFVLEPQDWVGETLPIAHSIDLDLSSGEWIVLLHRRNCPTCQEILPQYEQMAASGERVALVEVPPFGGVVDQAEYALCGRLAEDHEWFVPTPAEIRLRDGVVIAARHVSH